MEILNFFSSPNLWTVLGWIFGPLIAAFISDKFHVSKNDKNRRRASDEISEKVEQLFVAGVESIDKNTLISMCSYVSRKYNLKHKLLLSDILDQVNYEILSSTFVNNKIKDKVPSKIQELKNQIKNIDIKNQKIPKNSLQDRRTKMLRLLLSFYSVILMAMLILFMLLRLSVSDRSLETESNTFDAIELSLSTILAMVMLVAVILKIKGRHKK